jgi:ubiquinone/menaquinone biosynthesis C-methylase UbiE
MLKYAAIRDGHANDSIACLQADAMTLPLRSASFDWVICNSVFPHFLDQEACARELSRMLAPGGSFVVCHSQSREAINAFHRSHGGLIGGHELPEEPEMRDMLRKADLETTRYENEEDHYLLVAKKAN